MFRERARGSELLDRPGSDPRLVAHSYRLMRCANRAGGGIRVVRRFLEREFARSAPKDTTRILDVGAGDCDIALAVEQWARKCAHRVAFTCIDHQREAIEMGRQAIARSGTSAVKTELADIFRYEPAGEFDYAIASMFFHHLSGQETGRFIRHLRRFVRKALLINDLHRCLLNYMVCYALALRVEPALRHDALLSVRRGFTTSELREILSMEGVRATVTGSWFCRVAAVVRFDGRE